MTAKSRDELVFLPLGGSGEIGMNLNLYGFGPPERRKWVMVDLGITFGDELIPGVDVVMPDIRFIAERRRDLLGIVLTHAHEDHIGAVPHLWPLLRCPIYATPFTAHLVRAKLDEADIDAKVTEIALNGSFDLGPFSIELITLTHSIPEPNAVATALAKEHHMTPTFATARMYSQEPPVIDMNRLFGVTTFELG